MDFQKRILKEVNRLQKNPTTPFKIRLQEDNIYRVHASFLGPADTPFERGIYHTVIELPPNFPLSPPDIYIMTPSGRFVPNSKICTTFSSFHEETWSPGAWTIESMIIALASHFSDDADGAVGSMNSSDVAKARYAEQSQEYVCPQCGMSHSSIRSYLLSMRQHESGNPVQEEEEIVKEVAPVAPKNSDDLWIAIFFGFIAILIFMGLAQKVIYAVKSTSGKK